MQTMSGVSKFWCVNPKKVVIFSYLELKKRTFLVSYRVKINGFKFRETLDLKTDIFDQIFGQVPWANYLDWFLGVISDGCMVRLGNLI